MQVRNISPSPNLYRTNNTTLKKQQNVPSFKAKVVIDRDSFMKCKQNGYKLWNIAANLEPRLQKLSDEFEITLRGVRWKLYFLDYLFLVPKEGMRVELKYLIPAEQIKKKILDIEAENPFLYKRQIRELNNNDPVMMELLKKPTSSVMVFSKTEDKNEVFTPEEIKEFQENMYNKVVKMIDEMPDRAINYQRYY